MLSLNRRIVEDRISDAQAENARLRALIAELLLKNQRLREDASLFKATKRHSNRIIEHRVRVMVMRDTRTSKDKQMRILIIGASKGTGGLAVKEALARTRSNGERGCLQAKRL